jgi:negative regulator of sigma-B (phosphoserine phosphatase)
MERVSTGLLEWAAASRSMGSAGESGDICLVRVLAPMASIVVVDGLGHGAAAADAASRAIALLADAFPENPIAALERCHEGLRSTRGVVLSLACIDGSRDRMTWLGVGNVEGVLVHCTVGGRPQRIPLLARAGVVGRQLPPLAAGQLPIAPGDLLAFATDGIQTQFARDLTCDATPRRAADGILAKYATGPDDALVLVARYLGGGA